MLTNSLKKTVLAGCAIAAMGIGSANAAFTITEASADGSWFNAAQSGRGALIDYVPTGGTSGVLFVALYLHDTSGAPIWLTLPANVTEGQFALTNVPVQRTTGGTFSTTSPTVPSTQVGTASITFNTCEDLRISLTLTTAGLPNLPANQPVDLTFSRGGLAGPQCVYKQAFTACPAGTTAVAGQARTCQLPTAISSNLRLTNDATYIIRGATAVGSGFGSNGTASDGQIATRATLTIDPGTRLQGSGAAGSLDYLLINAGSRIVAEGGVQAPIVFTGPTETPGTWGGIVIAGQAVANNCVVAGTTLAGSCQFEAGAAIRYGGNNPDDSSGVLRYVQVRNGGQVIATDREFNSVTLLAVGRGTVIDHVQTHAGIDDGFEMFGGSVNLRYVVATATEDDSFDFDNGYNGKIQFAYGRSGGAVNSDSNGVESDNQPANGNFDALPRTQPTISNMTLVGVAGGNEGIRLRRGSGGNYWNTVVEAFAGECFNLNDNATFTVAGSVAAAGPGLTIRNSTLGICAGGPFEEAATDPFQISAWFNGQPGNIAGTSAGLTDRRFPAANSPVLGTGAPVTIIGASVPTLDQFFDVTDYKGAFRNREADWAVGWTFPGSL
jgi:hypothetical protein